MARYRDLTQFVAALEADDLVRRIARPVSVVHEMTEIHRRVLQANGPALLFEKPVDAAGRPFAMPVLVNLFGTEERIARGLGVTVDGVPALGEMLAFLRQPTAPDSLRAVVDALPSARAALAMGCKRTSGAPSQAERFLGDTVDLGRLPIQWCWPGEPAPLITWPLVITQAPGEKGDVNVGIYRLQVLSRNRLIVRWLAHRGGAGHHRQWQALGKPMPVAIAIGADPATILSAVMPLPEGMSELAFAGILRGRRTRVVPGLTVPLDVPADAEIVIEGLVSPDETAPEGPYGDHTGYFNAVEPFPVMQVTAVTMRRAPIYLSTFTGRPPDEPSRLGEVMTRLFAPIVKRQFPEVVDYWLPPEACSYRALVVSMDKRYPGQARRLMMGLWSILPQFTYTKLIIVVDADIDIRDWTDVMWAVATRFDAARDLMVVDGTPIDYLDFASPRPGLGAKMGLDATRKIGPETDRPWGEVLAMKPDVVARVDAMWDELGLPQPPLKETHR
jgi:4-hydroxy-3-polyprenylbenzoate decarboxylase